MAAGRKIGPEKKDAGTFAEKRSMRTAAEKKLKETPDLSPGLEGQTPEQLIHELQVHQVELETQAEELRRIQRELEKSRYQYIDLYEFAPVGYLSLNDKGIVTKANLTAATLLGVERSTLIRQGFSVFILPDHQATWYRYLMSLCRKEEKQGITLTIRKGGTTTFPARLEGSCLSPDDGSIVIHLTLSDISDIVSSQEALRNSHIRLESAMEAGSLAWWEMDCSTGKVSFSERKAAMLGYPAEQFSSYTDFTRLVHPDDYEPTMQAMRDHLSGIKKKYEADYRIRTRTGEYRWFHDTGGISAYDPSGVPLRVTGLVQDITGRKEAEEAIKESEAKFRVISDYTVNWESWFGPDGNYIWVSPSVALFTGHTAEEVLAMPDFISTVIAEEDRHEFRERFREAIRGSHGENVEFRYLHKNGTRHWLNVSWQPIVDIHGNSLGTRASGHDITDRKQMENSLNDAINWLNNVQRAAKAGFWGWNIPTGKLTWSEEFYRLFDLPSTAEASFDTWLSVVHPDDRASAVEKIEQSVRDHTDLWNEYRIVLRNGEEHWIGASGKSSYDETGQPVQMSGICIDITERKHVEKSLVESEQRYRGLIEGVPDYVLVHRNGKVLFVNPAAIEVMGYQDKDLVGSDILDYIAPESHELVVAMVAKRAAGEVIPPYEITIITKEGERKVTEVHGSLVMYEGAPASLNVLSDITRRKEAEEIQGHLLHDLTQKNAELERFTYTVSHDLKSPLITIKGFLGYLEKDALAGDAKRLHEDVVRIHAATSKMEEFIAALLDLSRVGRVVNPPVRVSLAFLVQDAVEALDAQVRERGVTLVIPGDLPEVYGDRVRLQQVMTNLIGNAIKFMGDQEEPRVEIGAHHTKGEEIICVRDNGIGIAPENLDKIFSVFTRLNPAIPGAGIGLVLVKRIVEVHGGKCRVESAGLGKGCSFCFSLPDMPPMNDKKIHE